MAAADAYLASFRPVQPFDSSGVRATEFTQALGAIPAANAAILAGAMKLGLEQANQNQQFDQTLAFAKDKFNAEQKNAKRLLALDLAQGFLGSGVFGGGGGGDAGFVDIGGGMDPFQLEQLRIQRNNQLQQERRNSTQRSAGVAGAILGN
jgi:hypothetical protein